MSAATQTAGISTPITASSPPDESYRWAPPARYLNKPRQEGTS